MALEPEERLRGPWHVTDVDRGHKVERIHVERGCRLSNRASRPPVRAPGAAIRARTCTVDGEAITVGLGLSIDVLQGSRHRLCKGGSDELAITAVHDGAWTGEDDLHRFEDDYGCQTRTAA